MGESQRESWTGPAHGQNDCLGSPQAAGAGCEPDFLSQNGEPLTPEERLEWCKARAREARARGATHHRFTAHPTEPHLILHEGWKVRPEDEGEPRFQFMRSVITSPKEV